MRNFLENGIRKLFGVAKKTMHNEDVEKNHNLGEEPSRNANDESEIQTSEPIDEVQAHGQYLSKKTYDSIKYMTSASDWQDIGDHFLRQKSPMGNTVLHIAALYENDNCMEKITENGSHLLAEKNANGDTPLHVAARAGHISTVKKLLAALLRKLPHPYSEKPKEALDEILVKNKQGNNFFHEAMMNGHKGLMSILSSQEQQIEAGFMELVEGAVLLWTNYEGVSVLHLAIWKGFEDIVDDALTKLTIQHPALLKLIENNQELARMILPAIPAEKPPLPEQEQEREMKKQQQDSTSTGTSRHFSPDTSKMEEKRKDPERAKEPEKREEEKKMDIDMEMQKDWENYRELGQLISRHFSPNTPKMEEKMKELEKAKKVAYRKGIICYKSRLVDMEMHRDWNSYYREPGHLILDSPVYVLHVKSPLIVAILKQDQGILQKILKKKKEWIHLRDNIGWTALHLAAYIGYLNGVEDLLRSCIPCSMERDDNSIFPLHLASAGGHVEVVKKLLEHCPDPREILDNYGRNFVHAAALMGKFNVVRYILQDANHGLVDMINDKDADGNTPLHLAVWYYHPKIVHALTWDKRVDLTLVNNRKQTALDAFMEYQWPKWSLRQRLTWTALKSAGVQYAKRGSVPPCPERAEGMTPYKDRINTLMLVSILITTVSFAAGFTLPGGTNSSNPGQGMAVMLNHAWFKPFIFCIAISTYGGISVTIILIWAQLEDITLALFALEVARPLLGVTLATLSVAFLAGVHLVISDLSWLVTAFLVLCVISILMLLFLYVILSFPSSSSNPIMRYISYYPFQFLAWLVEKDETKQDMLIVPAGLEREKKGRMVEGKK